MVHHLGHRSQNMLDGVIEKHIGVATDNDILICQTEATDVNMGFVYALDDGPASSWIEYRFALVEGTFLHWLKLYLS